MDLEEISVKVSQGICPSGIFGDLSGTPEEMMRGARAEFRSLARLCHPDVAPAEEKDAAEEIFVELNDLYKRVRKQIENGTYGEDETEEPGLLFTSRTREYKVTGMIATGEIADIYRASYIDDEGRARTAAVKVAMDEADNHLIVNEQGILKKLARALRPEHRQAMPEIIDTFKTPEGKAATVLEFLEGYDFESLRELPLYEKGIRDPYHIGWIMERCLAFLGHLHSHMIVLGNLEPRHLMLFPHNHNVVFVDFCHAVERPDENDYVRIKTPNYSAPEVSKKAVPGPEMDLYSLGQCMIYILGGNPGTGKIPDDIPAEYVRFIKKLTAKDPGSRADDAWEMARELVEIRKKFGLGNFRPLQV